MNDEVVKWIGIIGSVASLAGIIFTYFQIRKTLKAARAAEAASLKTQRGISHNLSLSTISICAQYLEEVKSFVRSKRFEAALIRVNDLILQLIQVRGILKSSEQIHQFQFRERLSQLSIIRDNFEKKLVKTSAKMDVVQINSQLSEIADDLSEIIGEMKMTSEKVKNGQSKI